MKSGAGSPKRRPRRGLRAGLAAILSISSTVAAGCEEHFDSPPEIIPARLDGEVLVPLQDGDAVELLRPIQGGHVLFIGAFVRNVNLGDGSILGELRRLPAPTSPGMPGAILVSDERSTELTMLPHGTAAPTADAGWRQVTADINGVANIPACPDYLPFDLVDGQLLVNIQVKDKAGRTAAAFRRVILRCSQTSPGEQQQCRCECTANYTIDRCFLRPDGGA